MSFPPSDPSRRLPPTAWPVIAAGAAGLAAIVLLALTRQADPLLGLAAALIVAGATAVCVFAAERSTAPADLQLQVGTVATRVETPPFESLVNALPDPILVVQATDPDDLTSRRYLFANAAAAQLLRLEQREGLLLNVIRDPEVLEAVDTALFGGVEAGCVYETAGVQPLTMHALARPLNRGGDGRRLAVLVFRDETEMRQVEQTRVDFLANASHELRTPLASLSGFIETLRGHAKDDEVARDRFLSIMQAQAGRMSRLIEDLMSLSRIELAEHIAPAQEVDVASCAAEVVEASTPLAARRGVELQARVPQRGVSAVLGDRDQIIQVVQNLVDNALKYSPDGKPVEVVLQPGLSLEAASASFRPGAARLALLTPDKPAAAYVALRISDHGPGILREHLPRLTERFYRVEGQKSGERAGSGLGLAIVKHIINRHRGGLTVESAPGEGATFTVYLPMAPVKTDTETLNGVAKVS